MELRQLEAFVSVAPELHFGRAAERLHMGQPTLGELVRRLEREVGTPLLTRTTRRVAVTGAGLELLGRAKVILDDVAAAAAAVRRIAHGDAGTVRLGITPPVAPVLAPHLRAALQLQAPEVDLVIARMWLPVLIRAVESGGVDVAMTCGLVRDPPGVDGAVGEGAVGEGAVVFSCAISIFECGCVPRRPAIGKRSRLLDGSRDASPRRTPRVQRASTGIGGTQTSGEPRNRSRVGITPSRHSRPLDAAVQTLS